LPLFDLIIILDTSLSYQSVLQVFPKYVGLQEKSIIPILSNPFHLRKLCYFQIIMHKFIIQTSHTQHDCPNFEFLHPPFWIKVQFDKACMPEFQHYFHQIIRDGLYE